MSISWNEAIPSNTSTVGTFPSYALSVYTAISTGLGQEMSWPSGNLLAGASRAFFGNQSVSSNSAVGDIVARALLTSDQSRLFGYDSTGTYLLGTPFCVEAATNAGRYMWASFSGSTSSTKTTSGDLTITLPASYQTNAYPIWFTNQTAAGNGFVFTLNSKSSGSFFMHFQALPTSTAALTFQWATLGPTNTY